jgi:hypothetical protein
MKSGVCNVFYEMVNVRGSEDSPDLFDSDQRLDEKNKGYTYVAQHIGDRAEALQHLGPFVHADMTGSRVVCAKIVSEVYH